MRRRNTEAREITAKFDGTCAETGKPVKRGEQCIYLDGKVYHTDSKTAEQFRSQRFSESWGMADANW